MRMEMVIADGWWWFEQFYNIRMFHSSIACNFTFLSSFQMAASITNTRFYVLFERGICLPFFAVCLKEKKNSAYVENSHKNVKYLEVALETYDNVESHRVARSPSIQLPR